MAEDNKTAVDIKRGATAPTPSRDMFGALREEIDRLFDDFTWPSFGRAMRQRPSVLEPMRDWLPSFSSFPAMDLIERNGGYELSVELPGMGKDDVDLRMTGGTLTVHAERTEEEREEKSDYHLHERRHGTIRRSIALPAGIDAEKVAAKFENGVLKVTMPKSAEAKSKERKIEVEAA